MEQIKLGLRITSIVVGILSYSAIWMWLINNRRNEKSELAWVLWKCFHAIVIALAFLWAWVQEDRMLDDKCCGTCKYHGFENLSDGWECVNDRSEYFADWTEYSDSCDEWEGRE